MHDSHVSPVWTPVDASDVATFSAEHVPARSGGSQGGSGMLQDFPRPEVLKSSSIEAKVESSAPTEER